MYPTVAGLLANTSCRSMTKGLLPPGARLCEELNGL